MNSGRISWGKNYPNLPPLDLILIQKESWQWFLEKGIAEALQSISPIEDFTRKNWLLEFGQHFLETPGFPPAEAKAKDLSFTAPLKVNLKLTNRQTGKVVEQAVFLADLPQMTPEGTFVINGIERCVVSQIVRAPGAYFTGEVDPASGRMFYQAEIRPIRGTWLEFFVGRNEAISVRLDRRRKFAATTLLRAAGIAGDEEIIKTFGEAILPTLEHDPTKTREEALIEIYRKMRPGEPVTLDNAVEFLFHLFFDGRRYELGQVGRYKLNKRLGLNLPQTAENWVLRIEDIVAAIKYLLNLQKGEGRVDDIDHLANRRLRRVGELICQAALRPGLLRLERMVKERMSFVSPTQEASPASMINARPVIAALNEFFRSNQLSNILDQTNPLSELDNLRRLSVMGPGGLTRERASFSIRDINSSQYGRICPIRTPEGPNIGLVTNLSLYARINEYGFIETPYRRVEKVKRDGKTKMKVTAEIVYLTADDEEKHYLTHAGIGLDQNGFITDTWVPARFGGEFLETSVEKIEFIDLVPRQVVGASTSLIPFLVHDEANRALMGSTMQCQAVPLLKPRSPIVGTGMETEVAQGMGWVVRARNEGEVTYVDANKVVIKIKNEKLKIKNEINSDNIKPEKGLETYFIQKFARTNPYGTCYSQRPQVVVGQKVEKGDLILDGPAAENGELALGTNLLIAYTNFCGLGYEDAIVVSDRLVQEDVLTSISIEEYEAAVVDTKLGPEELTRDIPNVSEGNLANLAEDGIITVGAEVTPGDILVGKIAPKGETELTAEERLLRAIFGEKAREIRDTSLRLPHGERGIVTGVTILDKDRGDELEPGTNKLIKVRVAQIRKLAEGDKLAGRHGNKGVIAKIMPAADLPYLPDGTPVDIVISPLSVLARMNLGQLLEAHLGLAAQKLGEKFAVPVLERIPEDKIIAKLKEANLPVGGKMKLIDGRTGEPLDQEVTVGFAYIIKLVHMVEDKVHARSTGPYSLVTQQPLGGKAQMGGQRFGEMEVWALEAHRAAFALQEMLTIKSDDVTGRNKAFEALIKSISIPKATIPESFRVLVSELKSLCLAIIPKGVTEVERTDEQAEQSSVSQEAEELAKAAGAELVPPTPEDN
jgi:DNA-directed RNA polymerase subunit beta